MRIGPARSRSACPERSRGDLRSFLLISAWPSFPFHLPPHRNVYRRCHRWSRGSPYPAGTAPDQVLRFGLRLSPTQNPIYTLTTSIASPGGRFDSQRDLTFITVRSWPAGFRASPACRSRWIATSNRYANMLIEVVFKYRPEAGTQQGLSQFGTKVRSPRWPMRTRSG